VCWSYHFLVPYSPWFQKKIDRWYVFICPNWHFQPLALKLCPIHLVKLDWLLAFLAHIHTS
jgi:hypothetical protein